MQLHDLRVLNYKTIGNPNILGVIFTSSSNALAFYFLDVYRRLHRRLPIMLLLKELKDHKNLVQQLMKTWSLLFLKKRSNRFFIYCKIICEDSPVHSSTSNQCHLWLLYEQLQVHEIFSNKTAYQIGSRQCKTVDRQKKRSQNFASHIK